jgi:hypothetical protein
MWRFYARVLLGIPRALWEASDWWSRIVEAGLLAGLLIPGLSDLIRDKLTAELYWITLGSFLALLLFGLLRSNYRAFENQERRAGEAEREAGRLTSELDEIARACPRFQLSDPIADRVVMHPGGHIQRPGRAADLYRVKVVNLGTVAAERTEVRISGSTPPIRSGLSTWLHQTDANIDPFNREFVLPPGEEAGKFIDVVFACDDEPGVMYVYHAISPDWDGKLANEAYEFTLTVTAATRGAETHSRDYLAKFDGDNHLHMTPMD